MLMPKRTKYRKQMKGRNRGYAYRGAEFSFGEYALKAVEAGRVNSRQIEAARIALTRFVKRQGKTQDKRHSRMTVVAEGEPDVLEQIEKQLAKLVDVSKIQMLPADASVCRELILIKVAAKPEERAQVIAIADIFRAKIVDVGEESMMIELTGNESKLDACTKLLEKFTILELARTGITGLSRGSENSLS